MRYNAVVNSETLAIIDIRTQTPTDAIAVIPGHMPDLEALVQVVPRDLAGELARLAAWRATGFDGAPGQDFDA